MQKLLHKITKKTHHLLQLPPLYRVVQFLPAILAPVGWRRVTSPSLRFPISSIAGGSRHALTVKHFLLFTFAAQSQLEKKNAWTTQFQTRKTEKLQTSCSRKKPQFNCPQSHLSACQVCQYHNTRKLHANKPQKKKLRATRNKKQLFLQQKDYSTQLVRSTTTVLSLTPSRFSNVFETFFSSTDTLEFFMLRNFSGAPLKAASFL